MKLSLSNKIKRDAVRLIKKQPSLKKKISNTLLLLSNDIFHHSLKTHKLKGTERLWFSSITYNLRIIFKISESETEKEIKLITLGSHDEVY